MPKFLMTELVDISDVVTARLGAGTGAANNLSDADVGKFVKLVGESRYDLCADGDEIEGRINSIETATQDGYTIGGVLVEGRFAVVFDGLQSTPGVGNIAIDDYVVMGTPIVKGTAIATGAAAKVQKATAAPNTMKFKYRVVSLGTAATGVPGTVGLIEKV